MKRLLEGVGVVLLFQGAVGLVHEFSGRLRGWGVVQRVGFAEGYELYLSVALVVLAGALFAAAESRGGPG
ncbi:hypothetical protein [Streptomyces sp. G45]|uniref:hypothetical protein n=1 Tax=Streptomyces sp. G45 TaxID=3406627 RepID=UPI003C2A47D5